MTWRRVALLTVGLATIVLATTGSASGGRSGGCTPGMTQVKGVSARVFCGPARATVKLGGKTLSFRNGSCDRASQYVSVNIGTVVLGLTTKRPDYFGLNVGRLLGAGTPATKDGTYKGSALAVDAGGKGYAVRADQISVTLTGNRSRGTFKATLLLGGVMTGAFTC